MGFKLLLTENQSVLGAAIHRSLEDYPYVVVCPPADSLEGQGDAALHEYLDEHRPGLVINTLSYYSPGAAPTERLAKACNDRQLPSLHLSSYRVFGSAYCESGAYEETATPQPDDALGEQLLQAETAALSAGRSIILRLPWLIHSTGDNVFTRVVSRLASDEPLEVSDVYRGCPTTRNDVARVVVAMVLQLFCGAENWGVFHLHTTDSCSEAEFADHISRLLEKEGQIRSGSIDVKRNPEVRLIEGCGLLAGNRCTNNFGIQLRSWRHGLKGVTKDWLERHKTQP